MGLSGGEVLEIRELDGRLELAPLPSSVQLEERPEGLVAVAEDDLPSLSDDLVREAIERSRG